MSDKFFRVVKAYLAKLGEVSAEEKQEALEELEKRPGDVDYYFKKRILTKEEAMPFALKVLEKDPYPVAYYFDRGLLTKEEAMPFVLKVLETYPHYVGEYFNIITKEEAKPFALKVLERSPGDVGDYFEKGIITKEEAMPVALKVLEGDPGAVAYYFDRGLLTKEEAKPFALKASEKSRQLVAYYFKRGILTKEEAKPFVLMDLEKNHSKVSEYFDKGLITAEEAKPFALKDLEKDPYPVGDYFENGIITAAEARPFALKELEKNCRYVGHYFNEGIITKEEAKPFALKFLEKDPYPVGDYFADGILTKEEAMPFVLRDLEDKPNKVGEYFNQGILTKEEAMPFVLRDLEDKPNKVGEYFNKGILSQEDVAKLKRSRPDSYTHSSHESKHEINLILGVMKKLNVDKISWQQFQEVHKSSSKKLENIFNTFKGKVVTREQCLGMLATKNTEQHTYGLSYEGLKGNSPQVFLKGKNLTVVKLHMPESLLSKLSPEARKRFNEIKSEHFTENDPFGWARVTRLGDKWFVEEIQSDKNRQIGKIQHDIKTALNEAKNSGTGNVTEATKRDQAFIKEMQNFSNWHEVLLSALLEAARESGVHEIYMHTGDTKLDQPGVKVNENKARNLYDKLPERMMFNKKKVNLGNGEHELWHRVASRVVYGYLTKVGNNPSREEIIKANRLSAQDNLQSKQFNGFEQQAGIGLDGVNYKFKIKDLIKHTENTPITKVHVKPLHESTREMLGEGSGEVGPERANRINAANLEFPIIVTKHPTLGLLVLDGTHRLEKAYNEGMKTIGAKVIPWKQMSRYKAQE